MTVRLILISYKNNRLTFQARAVIFLSWHHAFHDCNQDHKMSHTVISLQLSYLSLA